jgi:hypothetical protein
VPGWSQGTRSPLYDVTSRQPLSQPTVGDIVSTFNCCSNNACRYRNSGLDHASKRIRFKGYSITAWSRICVRSTGTPLNTLLSATFNPTHKIHVSSDAAHSARICELQTHSLVTMPQATETAVIYLKPDSNFEDTSSPAAAQLRKCLDIVAVQKGCQRQYYGRQLEDPSLFIWSIGPQSPTTEREPIICAAGD